MATYEAQISLFGRYSWPWAEERRTELGGFGDLEVTVGDLFDRDVTEGQHLRTLDESCRPVHIPDPGVAHRHLVVDVPALSAHFEINGVAEVEPALRLHCIGEDADDILVLAIELEL